MFTLDQRRGSCARRVSSPFKIVITEMCRQSDRSRAARADEGNLGLDHGRSTRLRERVRRLFHDRRGASVIVLDGVDDGFVELVACPR